ncbi:MAG TPA: hypothetical protein DDW14_07490, partial [Spirochaetaceae bacterium]|nr:hypothetical protein [Spirochaetaceae bacterium]
MSDTQPDKTARASTQTPRLHAAIEIGSTGIRLIVAELDAKGSLRILDRASKQSRLGRDVFTMGSISRDGLRETIAILGS